MTGARGRYQLPVLRSVATDSLAVQWGAQLASGEDVFLVYDRRRGGKFVGTCLRRDLERLEGQRQLRTAPTALAEAS